jgi:tetratricopeptide (TPR) repeat protein
MRSRLTLVVAVALVAVVSAVAAAPFVPDRDDVVLERLPEKGDPALAELKRMRAVLLMRPGDLQVAIGVARRAVDAALRLGDPRFLGQAQAALAPWWTGDDVPPAVMLLRASVKQAQHDFAGSLAELDRLVARHPELAQARLTRATILTVLGRYDEALRDCEGLVRHASSIVTIACEAAPASLSGNAAAAYEALMQALADPGGNVAVREWALTIAAEIAARLGDPAAAERHFRDALSLDPSDAYLKGAYADFLLDRGRPRDVLPLVENDTRNDVLLLRLALAEQRLPDCRAAFDAHRAELAARFDAARRRGDSTHRREEARFRLFIESDAAQAVKLARDNWSVQRESADLRILLEAARAAKDADAQAVAARWAAGHGLEHFAADNGIER